MGMNRRILLAVLVSSLLALGTSPAQAAWRNVLRDDSGDAPKRADISALVIAGNATSTSYTLRVRDVRSYGDAVFDLTYPRSTDVKVTVTKRRGKAPVVVAVKRPVNYEYGAPGPWRSLGCRVPIRWSAADNYVRIQIPNRCLDGAGVWRVAYASAGAKDVLRY